MQRGKTCRNREGMAMATHSIGRAVARATQWTVRFIRWLRVHIYSEAPPGVFTARLAAGMSLRSLKLLAAG